LRRKVEEVIRAK
jgi:hypothetical protein